MIRVANHPPVVPAVSNFTIPITTPFALTGSATDPDGDSLTYTWDFGDCTTGTGAQVSHLYPDNGVFPVTLTVDVLEVEWLN